MKKVVVLGGSGFLGQHVMAKLKDQGYRATPLSRNNGCDIRDLAQTTAGLRAESPDVVINCAAHVGSLHYAIQYAGEVVFDNTLLVANSYEAVRQACPNAKVINPISNCTYPGDADIQQESGWLRGDVHDTVLAYASARRLVYAFSECYRRQHGIKSVNWLIPNAYGPGDHDDPNKVHALNGILIRLIKAQQKGDRSFEIWGTGKPLREWVYIEDAAEILLHSIEHVTEQIQPLNLAQNKAYSIAEIAELGARALHYDVQFVFNTKYPDGAPVKVLDDRQFRERYPDFQFTPLEEGIRNTVRYYQARFGVGTTANMAGKR